MAKIRRLNKKELISENKKRKGKMSDYGGNEKSRSVWKKGDLVTYKGKKGKITGSAWDSIKESRLYDVKLGKKKTTNWGYADQFRLRSKLKGRK
tara:strand:+ start:422 stop:703 length:282 start_codon:yes stop_codon:yes gene_type:complete